MIYYTHLFAFTCLYIYIYTYRFIYLHRERKIASPFIQFFFSLNHQWMPQRKASRAKLVLSGAEAPTAMLDAANKWSRL